MKKLMGKKRLQIFAFVLLFVFLFLSLVSAYGSCSLNVSLINQDPYPAVPGDYVEVVFQVSGTQNLDCGGAKFELIPFYPLYLDQGDGARVLEGGTWVADYKKEWMIPFKLRVDENAVDGETEVKVRYGEGSSDTSFVEKFNIAIQDSRTEFDAVIQEVSGSDVSIAIANTGKYVANSVVVRIPEQDNFRVTGTDGQMVGNLDTGDYTIVSFSLTSAGRAPTGNMNRTINRTTASQRNNLKFDIYYTDALGIRRTINMELPLDFGSAGNFTAIRSFTGGRATQSRSWWSNWYILIIILIIACIVFILYKKYHKKTREIHKPKNKNTGSVVPDWIKKIKGRENNT